MKDLKMKKNNSKIWTGAFRRVHECVVPAGSVGR